MNNDAIRDGLVASGDYYADNAVMAHWDPNLHPRDTEGQFTDTPGAGVELAQAAGVSAAAIHAALNRGGTAGLPIGSHTSPPGYAHDTPEWVSRTTDLDPAKLRNSIKTKGGTVYEVGQTYNGVTLVASMRDPEAYGRGTVIYRNRENQYFRLNTRDFVRGIALDGMLGGNKIQASPVVPRTRVVNALAKRGLRPAKSRPSSVRGFPATTPGYQISRADDGTWGVQWDEGVGSAARQSVASGVAERQQQALVQALRNSDLIVSIHGGFVRVHGQKVIA